MSVPDSVQIAVQEGRAHPSCTKRLTTDLGIVLVRLNVALLGRHDGVLSHNGKREGPTLRGWTLLRSNSGAEGDRTPDLLNAIQALSHLSYSPSQAAVSLSPCVSSVKINDPYAVASTRAMSACSSTIGMPSSSAFVLLEPAFWPAISKSVLALTLDVGRPPMVRTISCTS